MIDAPLRLGTLSLLPDEVRAEAGLPETGVAVLAVAPGGAAEAAGLRAPAVVNVLGLSVPDNPDVIIAIDGRPVSTAEDVNLAISYEADFGQETTLTVIRNGEEQEVPVTLSQ